MTDLYMIEVESSTSKLGANGFIELVEAHVRLRSQAVPEAVDV
jgi:hypothetical protein